MLGMKSLSGIVMIAAEDAEAEVSFFQSLKNLVSSRTRVKIENEVGVKN